MTAHPLYTKPQGPKVSEMERLPTFENDENHKKMEKISKQEIIIGNNIEVLKNIESESIDLVVTSPPYWALRDYNSKPIIWGGDPDCEHVIENQQCMKCGAWKGQLGLEPTPFEYIEHLVSIFDEVKRVLKPTGSCWVNIGDTYSTISGSGFADDKIGGVKQKRSIKGTNSLRKNLNGIIPNKCLCQIPSRFAIAMCDHGWILHNECIWKKPNVMPSSIKDRFTIDFEPFYFFTKNPKYYFNQIKEDVKCPNTKSRFSSKKDGNPNGTYSGKKYDSNEIGNKRNARTVWEISTVPSKYNHCAMFPKTLIDRPIQSCCPENGVVLDPFAGSGTVLEYCFENNINGIGIEINPDFKEIIEKRMKKNQRRIA